MPHKVPANPEPLDSLIHEIRGERVILDADLARVYGVEARVLNQTVKRNPERFPSDFAFQLTAREAVDLKSQIGISNSQESAGKGVTMNSSQIVMSSRRGKSYRPWAFTEHGALMAGNVLRSERAVQMSVYLVRAFVSLRAQLAGKADALRRLDRIDEKLLEHDEALLIVWRQIKDLMQRPALPPPPPAAPKRRIGFHS